MENSRAIVVKNNLEMLRDIAIFHVSVQPNGKETSQK